MTMMALASLAGTGLGMLDRKQQQKDQIKQQQKLQDMQIKGQKEMGEFNQGLALDMWNKTGAEAQRKQLEKAGLNVGLMYGGSGSGGGTTSTPTGSVSGGSASLPDSVTGMGIQAGLQMALLKAQKENIEADTEKKKADAEKTAGVDTKLAENSIEKLKQDTANAAIQGEIARYQEEMAKVDANIKTNTQWDIQKQIEFATWRTEVETKKAATEGRITEETANEVIKQINTNSIEQSLRIRTQKAGLIKTEADTKLVNETIKKIAADINNMEVGQMQGWAELTYQQREVKVKELLMKYSGIQTLFNTSEAAQMKQWTSIMNDVAAMSNAMRVK